MRAFPIDGPFAAQSYRSPTGDPDTRAESLAWRDEHRASLPPEGPRDEGRRRRWLGQLALIGGLGTIALTAQILVAHHLSHRGTSLVEAAAWAIATFGTWTMVALVITDLADRIPREAPRRELRLAAVALLGLGLAITLRAAINPVLPEVARSNVAFVERWVHYAVRWTGPGAIAVVAILLAHALQRPPLVPSNRDVESPPVGDGVVVRVGGKSLVVRPDEIRWIEAAGNYAYLHLDGRTLTARGTMADFAAQLDSAAFVRVHRSAIVSLAAVKELRTTSRGQFELVLLDGEAVRVSRVGRRELQGRLGMNA